jgi:hypothetical protein
MLGRHADGAGLGILTVFLVDGMRNGLVEQVPEAKPGNEEDQDGKRPE